MSIEISVLGPLQVSRNGEPLNLGTPQRKRVLALLALRVRSPISLDELIQELWHGCPPSSAVAKVRGYASGLRRLFASALTDTCQIRRAGSGYMLVAEDASVDIRRFGQLAANARAAAASGDLVQAAHGFEAALRCWRGVMLDGLTRGQLLAGQCIAAEHERLSLVDDAAETYLRLGQPTSASALLWPQVCAEPLRERSYTLLIRACYHTDGLAKALQVYDGVRVNLAEQLGVEPSAELHRLHRAVLCRSVETDAQSGHRIR